MYIKYDSMFEIVFKTSLKSHSGDFSEVLKTILSLKTITGKIKN